MMANRRAENSRRAQWLSDWRWEQSWRLRIQDMMAGNSSWSWKNKQKYQSSKDKFQEQIFKKITKVFQVSGGKRLQRKLCMDSYNWEGRRDFLPKKCPITTYTTLQRDGLVLNKRLHHSHQVDQNGQIVLSDIAPYLREKMISFHSKLSPSPKKFTPSAMVTESLGKRTCKP